MSKRKYRFTNLNNYLGRRLIYYIITAASKPLFYRCLDSALKNEDFSLPALYDLYCLLLEYGFTIDKVDDYIFVGVETKNISRHEARYYKILYRRFFKIMYEYEYENPKIMS